MHSRLPVILLSALALAAPGLSYAKDKYKDKDKDKNKGHEQKADERDDERDDDRDDDRDRDRDHKGEDRDRDGDHHGEDRGGKITICHVPPGNHSARHTISVGASAWPAHQAHGDRRGACGAGGGGTNHGRFDTLDRNHDGFLSRNEWYEDGSSFDRADRNNDGVVSRIEFARF